MSDKCVSADSSFYICLSDDLGRRELLDDIMSVYRFHAGVKILSELPDGLKQDGAFVSRLELSNRNFFELMKPFFGRSPRHEADGEYEAIGIGYFLLSSGRLAYLILDDNHLPFLSYVG